MRALGKGNSRTGAAELSYAPPVQNFVNVEALCGVMEKAYEAGAGAPGRDLFARVLVTELEFTTEQAELYRLSTPLEESGPRATDWSMNSSPS